MFQKASKQKLVVLMAPIGLAVSLSFSAASADAAKKYVTSGYGESVVNSYGECWEAKGGVPHCGPVEEEVPEPAVVAVVEPDDKCPGTPSCEVVDSITINTTTAHFDFDSAKLKPAMISELDDFATQLNASAANEAVTVVGHTDSIGTDAYNQGLSERRAQSVATYLSGKGIDNMSISGMGESSPVASNATSEGRAQNRRVEINTK